MEIKVECPCGAHFAFEVEPVNGRMPMPLACPDCGGDATALANAIIKERLAPAGPKPELRVVIPPTPSVSTAPAAMPPNPSPPRVAVAVAIPLSEDPPAPPLAPALETGAALPEVATAGGARPYCNKHRIVLAESSCVVCGKPICLHCMEIFGYLCSAYCRTQAERRKIPVPVYAGQMKVAATTQTAQTRKRIALAAAILVLLAGLWGFYRFFLSQPRPAFSQKIPKGQRRVAYQMISPTEILSVNEKKIALLDFKKNRPLWSADFDVTRFGYEEDEFAALRAARAADMAAADEKEQAKDADQMDVRPKLPRPSVIEAEEEPFVLRARVVAAPREIWFIENNQIARFDRMTGKRKEDIKLPRPVVDLSKDKDAIVAISAPSESRRVLTRITLADGVVQTQDVTLETPTAPRGGSVIASLQDEFLIARPTVVQLSVRLLEEKIATFDAMKPKTGPGVMESGNVTAGRSLEAAQEMINDWQRESTGGKAHENQSRYMVTLRRWLAKDAPEWTGEITGPPAFHPLKTVDVLAGGRSITVFDKKNKKLWDSKLTFPISRGGGFDSEDEDSAGAPCVEAGKDLYVFDAGVLTRFDLVSGTAHWRLNSVGITQVLVGEDGQVYAASTTASPDSIKYSQQVNLSDKPKPMILKVDAASGRELWQIRSVGDQLRLSGKYLYSTWTTADRFSALDASGEPQMHFNLHRINPATGKSLWHFYQNRAPRRVDFEGREIMLHFRGELMVLNYWSF